MLSMLPTTVALFMAFLHPGSVSRESGETLKQFGSRVVPPKSELAHPPVQAEFGPGPGSIVVLTRPADDINTNYSGLIFAPTANRNEYRKLELPPLSDIPGRFEIDVKSVFFEDVDGDSTAELLILCHYHRNGSEEDDTNAVHIYKWQNQSFIRLEKLEDNLTGLSSAAAVRLKLRKLQTTQKK